MVVQGCVVGGVRAGPEIKLMHVVYEETPPTGEVRGRS